MSCLADSQQARSESHVCVGPAWATTFWPHSSSFPGPCQRHKDLASTIWENVLLGQAAEDLSPWPRWDQKGTQEIRPPSPSLSTQMLGSPVAQQGQEELRGLTLCLLGLAPHPHPATGRDCSSISGGQSNNSLKNLKEKTALLPQECPYSDPSWGNDPRATPGGKPGTICMCVLGGGGGGRVAHCDCFATN